MLLVIDLKIKLNFMYNILNLHLIKKDYYHL